jgi:hypothetical protein
MVRIAPPLILDEASRVYHVADAPNVPEDVFSFAKERVRMAYQNALATSQTNGFTETSYEAIAINAALSDPQVRADVLAGAFCDAAFGFVGNIGDIYPKDMALVNLKNVLWAASEEICDADEAARLRCLRLSKLQASKDAPLVDVKDLDEMVAVAQEAADLELSEILEKDKGVIATAMHAPRWVKARFLSYMTTIGDFLERAKKGDARVSWLVRRLDDLWGWFKDGAE